MNPLRAVFKIFLGDLRRGPGSAVASVLAIAAGVSIFVAIRLAGSAARSSFVSAVEAVSGRGTHEVARDGGLAEERLVDLIALPAVASAQPIVEGMAAVRAVRRGGTVVHEAAPPLRILGIDPFLAVPFVGRGGGEPVIAADDFTEFLTRPGTVVLPEPWATSMAARAGDTVVVAVAGRAVELEVLAIYGFDVLGEAARDTAVVDIATAQEILSRIGRLDRIDLIVEKGEEAALEAALEPGERLERPSRRGERVASMVDAFRLNLLALGSLALLVGSLLVFNACQFRVVRRSGLLGQLRCLGVTRQLVVAAVLLEMLLFGAAGGALGLVGGVVLAQWLAGSVAQTITDLYAFVRVEVTPLEPGFASVTFVATLVIAVAAGWFPALDAARSAPRMVGIRSREELLFRRQLPRLIAIGVAATIAAFAVLQIPGGWWVGLVAAFSLLVAGAVFVPPFMGSTLPTLQRLAERGGQVTLPIAAGSVYRSLTRTGGAAAALGVALAMTIGVIVMIASFEQEVRRWIGASLRADIYIADRNEKISRGDARIPAAALDEIRRTPGVRAVDTLRGLEVAFRDRSIFFCGVELLAERSRERFEFLEGNERSALEAVDRGAVLISEPLSNHHDIHAGDTLVLQGRRGEERFPVAGVIRDFSFDRGYGFTSRERYVEAFGDTGVRNAAVYLEPQFDPEEIAAALRRTFSGRYELRIRSNARLRGDVLEVFNRTFAVTYLLQVIATLLALAGVGVTLFGLFLERAREVATLRSLGATTLHVGRLFATESFLMALFPVLLALPLGAVLAWILICVVNLRAFGWTITMGWPWAPVLSTCGLAMAAGLSATIVPLVLVRRQSIARALRDE